MAAINTYYADTNNYPVAGEKGKAKTTADVSAVISAAEAQDILTGLLKAYDAAKTKLEEMGQSGSHLLAGLPNKLTAMLSNNPLWISLNTPNAAQKPPVSPPDIQNFFSVIFTYMKDNSDSASKVQIAQAVNILAKQELISLGTKEGQKSVNTLESQLQTIQHEQEEADSFLGWLEKIILPVVMVVVLAVTITATVLSGGAAAPALAAEIPLETITEAAVEEGTGTLVEETLVDAAVAAAGEGAGEGATAGASQAAAGAGITESAADPALSAEEVAQESIESTEEEGSSSLWQQAKAFFNSPVMQFVGTVVRNEAVFAALEAATPMAIQPAVDGVFIADTEGDVANQSAEAVVQSAAINNLQGAIQEDMQVASNEQQIQQSDMSMINQVLTAMPTIDSIGNPNSSPNPW